MSEILRRLHDDHVNLLRVLAILERQIAVMDRGDRPDWAIVHGVIEYLLTYPDLHHHPLEDGILKRLQATNPSTAEAFSGLLAEHREQSDALRRIAAATPQLPPDASIAPQGYAGLLRSFLVAQRDHVRREEADFFPAAECLLDETDWAELDRQASAMADPLFGDRVEQGFRLLRRELAFLDAADRMVRRAEQLERSGIVPHGPAPLR